MTVATSASLVVAVIAALVAAAAAWQAVGMKSRVERLEQRAEGLENSVRQILEHFRGLSAGAVGQGEHLARVEQNLSRVRRRLDQVASSGGSDGSRFNQAIRMARKGSSPKEIMETCEISQVEADLVVLVHAQGGDGEEHRSG